MALEINESLLVEPETMEWQEQAACLNYDLKARDEEESNPFFDTQRHKEALAICKACPVRIECLRHSLAYDKTLDWALVDTDTIYGGLNGAQRRRILKRYNLLKQAGKI